MRSLAWVLGLAGTVGCCVGAILAIEFAAPRSFLLVYMVGILMGVLGALVASREPHNSIGWLMCATSICTSLLHIPTGYAYLALAINHGSWVLGSFAAWFGAWSWVPVIAFLPVIAVRFPDGKIPRHMRAVDWIAIAGVALFALAIALDPASRMLGFMSVPSTAIDRMLPYFHDSVGGIVPLSWLVQIQGLGLAFIVTSYVASATALVTRYRGARGERRLQLEWFAYAGAIVAAALAYGGIAYAFLGQPLYIALTPFEVAAATLPIAIGVAILRYRLYDIDLLINRTLVYLSLTAILGALYVAAITFFNRLFISLSGQKSDAAYVVTAFVVAVAFGPIRDWLQRHVNRWVGRGNATQQLDQFRSSVDAVVAVIDVDRILRKLVDQAVTAFNARGAELYLTPAARPVYTRGEVNGAGGVEVTLRHGGREVGRLVMGSRRGGALYSERDRLALQSTADSVADAIELAEHRGLPPEGTAP